MALQEYDMMNKEWNDVKPPILDIEEDWGFIKVSGDFNGISTEEIITKLSGSENVP